MIKNKCIKTSQSISIAWLAFQEKEGKSSISTSKTMLISNEVDKKKTNTGTLYSLFQKLFARRHNKNRKLFHF